MKINMSLEIFKVTDVFYVPVFSVNYCLKAGAAKISTFIDASNNWNANKPLKDNLFETVNLELFNYGSLKTLPLNVQNEILSFFRDTITLLQQLGEGSSAQKLSGKMILTIFRPENSQDLIFEVIILGIRRRLLMVKNDIGKVSVSGYIDVFRSDIDVLRVFAIKLRDTLAE